MNMFRSILFSLSLLLSHGSFSEQPRSDVHDVPQTREDCAKNSATQWDANRNMCVFKQQTVDIREDFQKCQEFEGTEDHAECVQSLRDVAIAKEKCKTIDDKEASKKCTEDLKEGFDRSFKEDAMMAANSAAMVHGIYAAIYSTSKTAGKSCTSSKILMGAGIGSFVSDLYLRKKAKDLSKDLIEKYKEESTYDAQKSAFKYMIEHQKNIKDLAQKHEKAYLLQSIGYTTAAVVALLEVTMPTSFPPCYSESAEKAKKDEISKDKAQIKSNEDLASKQTAEIRNNKKLISNNNQTMSNNNSLAEGEKLYKNSNVPSVARPQGWTAETSTSKINQLNSESARLNTNNTNLVNQNSELGKSNTQLRKQNVELKGKIDGNKAELKTLQKGGFSAVTGKGLSSILSSSAGILVTSGVTAGMAKTLHNHAKNAVNTAENRIKILEKAKNSFEDSLSLVACQSREDMSNPRCYCYTNDGKKNPSRTNSDICNKRWAQDDYGSITESNYSNPNDKKPGCLYKGNYDATCQCKNYIDSETRENLCDKALAGTQYRSAFQDPTAIRVASDAARVLDEAYGSDVTGASLDVDRLQNVNRAIKKLHRQLKKQAAKDFKKETGTTPRKAALSLSKSLTNAAKNKKFSPPPFMTKSNTANIPKDILNAIKKIEEDPNLKNQFKMASINHKNSKNKRRRFNFDVSSGNGKNIENFMNNEYDYSSSEKQDIINRPSTPIWSIISHRYHSSGLRRLFPD